MSGEHAHDWRETGDPYLVSVRVNGIVKGKVRRQNVKCRCGATGFRREWSPVVYTCQETLS